MGYPEEIKLLVMIMKFGGNEFLKNSQCHRHGHTVKSAPHPIPNCAVKLVGLVQYWGGGPLGKFRCCVAFFGFGECVHRVQAQCMHQFEAIEENDKFKSI